MNNYIQQLFSYKNKIEISTSPEKPQFKKTTFQQFDPQPQQSILKQPDRPKAQSIDQTVPTKKSIQFKENKQPRNLSNPILSNQKSQNNMNHKPQNSLQSFPKAQYQQQQQFTSPSNFSLKNPQFQSPQQQILKKRPQLREGSAQRTFVSKYSSQSPFQVQEVPKIQTFKKISNNSSNISQQQQRQQSPSFQNSVFQNQLSNNTLVVNSPNLSQKQQQFNSNVTSGNNLDNTRGIPVDYTANITQLNNISVSSDQSESSEMVSVKSSLILGSEKKMEQASNNNLNHYQPTSDDHLQTMIQEISPVLRKKTQQNFQENMVLLEINKRIQTIFNQLSNMQSVRQQQNLMQLMITQLINITDKIKSCEYSDISNKFENQLHFQIYLTQLLQDKTQEIAFIQQLIQFFITKSQNFVQQEQQLTQLKNTVDQLINVTTLKISELNYERLEIQQQQQQQQQRHHSSHKKSKSSSKKHSRQPSHTQHEQNQIQQPVFIQQSFQQQEQQPIFIEEQQQQQQIEQAQEQDLLKQQQKLQNEQQLIQLQQLQQQQQQEQKSQNNSSQKNFSFNMIPNQITSKTNSKQSSPHNSDKLPHTSSFRQKNNSPSPSIRNIPKMLNCQDDQIIETGEISIQNSDRKLQKSPKNNNNTGILIDECTEQLKLLQKNLCDLSLKPNQNIHNPQANITQDNTQIQQQQEENAKKPQLNPQNFKKFKAQSQPPGPKPQKISPLNFQKLQVVQQIKEKNVKSPKQQSMEEVIEEKLKQHAQLSLEFSQKLNKTKNDEENPLKDKLISHQENTPVFKVQHMSQLSSNRKSSDCMFNFDIQKSQTPQIDPITNHKLENSNQNQQQQKQQQKQQLQQQNSEYYQQQQFVQIQQQNQQNVQNLQKSRQNSSSKKMQYAEQVLNDTSTSFSNQKQQNYPSNNITLNSAVSKKLNYNEQRSSQSLQSSRLTLNSQKQGQNNNNNKKGGMDRTQKGFYGLCLEKKLALPKEHPAQQIPICMLYRQVQSQNIPYQTWNDFIEQKFKEYSD